MTRIVNSVISTILGTIHQFNFANWLLIVWPSAFLRESLISATIRHSYCCGLLSSCESMLPRQLQLDLLLIANDFQSLSSR